MEQVRGSIVVSISACHAEDPGSIPGRGAACTDRAHHNGQLLMRPGLGQRVPCFWVCPPSSAVLGRRRWPQNRTKGQQARAERDGPRPAQICRSRCSWPLGPRAAAPLMGPRHQWGRSPWAHAAAISSEIQTKTGRSRQQVRGSIVVSISARHAEDPGSIPGRGATYTHPSNQWGFIGY